MFELSETDLVACTQTVAVRGAVSTNASPPYKIPDVCQGKVVPYKIAIAPATTFTRDYFMQTMESWNPRIDLGDAAIPSLRDSVMLFDAADALETYVQSDDYGLNLDNPRVAGAIVCDQLPDNADVSKAVSIEYTIRLNSTQGRDGDGEIPRTIGDLAAMDPFRSTIRNLGILSLPGHRLYDAADTRHALCHVLARVDAATTTTTGVCQNARATAKTSDELDARLLSTLSDDVRLQVASRQLLNTSSFASLLDTARKDSLQVKLRSGHSVDQARFFM